MTNLKRNISIYKLVRVFGLPAFWSSVLYIFFTIEKGFSPTEALTVSAIYSMGIVMLEIPTGSVSDIFSRKISISLGLFLKGLAIFSYVFIDSFVLMCIASILAALGESLFSGSDSSILYDSLLDHKEEDRFKKIISNAAVYTQVFMGITLFVGGLIGEINLNLPLLISFPFYIVGSVGALFFDEPKSISSSRRGDSSNSKHILYALKSFFIINDKFNIERLLIVLGHFFIMGFYSSVIFWFPTPILDSYGISIGYIAFVVMFFRFSKAFGASLFGKFDIKRDYLAMFLSSFLMFLLMFIIGILNNVWITLVGLGLVFLVGPYYQYNFDQKLNTLITSKFRATLTSFFSLIMRLYAVIFLPVFGMILEESGISSANLFLSGGLLIGSIILLYFARKEGFKVSST